jgi:DNA polymerase III epsilon subunit-like protein
MPEQEWILLDTETTGFAKPIYVVELGAQRMNGWEPQGEPFCELVNHGRDISDEAQRVHGYTREILERDGSPPEEVYENFREYVDGLPLVSYNSSYDLKQVLYPEWERLGIEKIGTEGFCALELTQRLLDPVPAGNCKLQSLRQFYRLPQRGAHSAMGDVETVVDLMKTILRPIAAKRDLDSWEDIIKFTSGDWYPSKLAFGKFKGRFFWEAKQDSELRDWLIWLSESKKPRQKNLGNWYLNELDLHDGTYGDLFAQTSTYAAGQNGDGEVNGEPGLIVYTDPEKEQLDEIIAGLRARMAEVEANFTLAKMSVDHSRAKLFKRLKPLYEERDLLKFKVEFRKRYIDALTKEGEQAAEQVAEEYEEQKNQTSRDYAEAEKTMDGKKRVSKEVPERVQKLWKKLCRLYHPDKHMNEPEKQKIYDKLQACINDAKDNGNIDLLEEIEADPEGFIRDQGWGSLDLSSEADVMKLRSLAESLQARILEMIEAINMIEESPAYSLHTALETDEDAFDKMAQEQADLVEEDIKQLRDESDELGEEIKELTGKETLAI